VTTSEELEARAWLWLQQLERIPWETTPPRQYGQQVVIRMLPGSLGAGKGEPWVRISARHPAIERRVKGSGNSLAEAADRLHRALWELGVELDWPNGTARRPGPERG